VLSLFSTALHGSILRSLGDGPMRLSDLHRATGGPPQTTLRGNLDNLIGIGALEKRRRDGGVNVVDNELTPFGRELLGVADSLEAWLGEAPSGPLSLESGAGKAAIKALIGGWSSTMLRALAARPFSLTELDNLITAFSYPALERRLSAMAICGQVVAMPSPGAATPYMTADWLRQGVAPLLLAARCEARHMAAETAPLARIDIEAMMLLAAPLASLFSGAAGACQLTVEMSDGSKLAPVGIRMEVEQGRIVSCVAKLGTNPESWAHGPAVAWLEAIAERDLDRLQLGGDRDLVLGVLGGLSDALFPRSLVA
jgi:DNA-binding HxlR family transcriptional regulator